MRLKWYGLAAMACCLAVIPRSSFADTLHFTGSTGTTVNVGSETAYVYPYDFSVNGSSTTTQLMCISFADEITTGETWNVNVESISQAAGGNSTLLTDYEEEAYLFSLFTPSTSSSEDAMIQMAAWAIFDKNGVETNSDPEWVNNKYQIQQLINEASYETGQESASFYNSFYVYVPAAGLYDSNTGYPDGIPQTFIGDAPPPSAAPEPASLALLGTSLLGTMGVLRRKMRKS